MEGTMAESSEPREVRWAVVWHGYVREMADGEVVREEGTGCRMEGHDDGSWVLCDERGCYVVRGDNRVRFEWIARALLRDWEGFDYDDA
jgi:hypothetical protein